MKWHPPVSYTHLDVYKRQTVRYIEKAGRTVEVIFGPSNDYRCQVEIDGAGEFWVYEEDVENIISTFTKELQ